MIPVWAIHLDLMGPFQLRLLCGSDTVNLSSSSLPATSRNKLKSMVRARARMLSLLSDHAPKAAATLLTKEYYCQKSENLASYIKLVAISHFLKKSV